LISTTGAGLDELAGDPGQADGDGAARDETEPGEARADDGEPGELDGDPAGWDGTKPGDVEPGQADPDEADPDEADPDEADPDEADPDEADPDEADPDLGGPGGVAAPEPAVPAGPELVAAGVPEVLAVPAILSEASRLVTAWAKGRSLGASSLCGISVALALCSAAWFTAGTRPDNLRAVAALWAGYLALLAARGVVSWQESEPLAARSGAAARSRWLAVLGWCLSECLVYAGLGAGAAAQRWTGAWMLAVTVLSVVAVRELMAASAPPVAADDEPPGRLRLVVDLVLSMPAGGRVLLIGIVAPVWGCRAALLVLLDWAIIAICYCLISRWPSTQEERAKARQRLLRLRDDGALARRLGRMVRGNLLPLPPAILGLLATAMLAYLGLRSLPAILILTPALVMLLAAPGAGNAHAGRLDWLVPAVLLGWQCLYLATVGLAEKVPGPVTLALCAALVLRFADLSCPGRPVMLTSRPPPDGQRAPERGTALGWEGRMLLMGAAAGAGIGMYAYLALTAYLCLLICAKITTSRLTVRNLRLWEGDGR
jgi:hypothetical protein